MTLTNRTESNRRPRFNDDGGSGLVEFSLVMVLLFTLIFGIINYGLILSFKQDLTRAAAEGARAAAVAFPAANAVSDAEAATEEAVQAFDETCAPGGGLTCTIELHDCDDPVPDLVDDPAKLNCVQVDLLYDYEGHPLLPPFPIFEPFLPAEIRATSDSRTNT